MFNENFKAYYILHNPVHKSAREHCYIVVDTFDWMYDKIPHDDIDDDESWLHMTYLCYRKKCVMYICVYSVRFTILPILKDFSSM